MPILDGALRTALPSQPVLTNPIPTHYTLNRNRNLSKVADHLTYVDGGLNIIPGVNFTPFEDFGLYNSSELGLGWSQFVGSATRDIVITISSFGFYSGAAGANATLGRTLFATEFAPTPLSFVISGEAALTPANVTLNYIIKTGGRISTGISFAENLGGGPGE